MKDIFQDTFGKPLPVQVMVFIFPVKRLNDIKPGKNKLKYKECCKIVFMNRNIMHVNYCITCIA